MSKRLKPILIDLMPGDALVMMAKDSQGRTISFNVLKNPLDQPLNISIEVTNHVYAQWVRKEEDPL